MANKTSLSPLVKEIIALEKQVAPLNAVIELMEIESSFADELKLILEKNHLEHVWEELIAHSDKLAAQYPQAKMSVEQSCSITVFEREAMPGHYFLSADDVLRVYRVLYPYTPDDAHVVDSAYMYKIKSVLDWDGERRQVLGNLDHPVTEFLDIHFNPIAPNPSTKMSVTEFITSKLKMKARSAPDVKI